MRCSAIRRDEVTPKMLRFRGVGWEEQADIFEKVDGKENNGRREETRK